MLTTILLWGFGILGGAIVLVVVAGIVLEWLAADAQDKGNNWFR